MKVTKPTLFKISSTHLDEAIEKIEKKLKLETPGLEFYSIKIDGNYDLSILKKIKQIYSDSGWVNVDCHQTVDYIFQFKTIIELSSPSSDSNDFEERPKYYVIQDKNGRLIKEGEKFKFKYIRDLDNHIELIGSFCWNETDLRYEIDIFENEDYDCLSYESNGIMYGFEFLKNDETMNKLSNKMEEFIDKIDSICFEYGYEIHPTIEGWTGKLNENKEYDTFAIIGNGERIKLTHIDGDGRGK